ncbi:MAG: hypothetical protein LBO69_08900 [Ignavibacteria bacterium]|jgi:hypothetical protein|nr:hypothetical protein [Ignavibacteria bacterium]
MKMYRIALISILLLAISCQTAYIPPECITPDYKDFQLEWGYDDGNLEYISGYILDESGYIRSFRQSRESKVRDMDTVRRIDGTVVCYLLSKMNTEVARMPMINEPGKRLTFIMLTKPAVDMRIRIVWNEYSTYASKGYRALFDTLMSVVKNKKEK